MNLPGPVFDALPYRDVPRGLADVRMTQMATGRGVPRIRVEWVYPDGFVLTKEWEPDVALLYTHGHAAVMDAFAEWLCEAFPS